jgi:hypothetical protein
VKTRGRRKGERREAILRLAKAGDFLLRDAASVEGVKPDELKRLVSRMKSAGELCERERRAEPGAKRPLIVYGLPRAEPPIAELQAVFHSWHYQT